MLHEVVRAVNEHFAGITAATLDRDDVGAISALLASAPRLKYLGVGPETFRQREAESHDSNESTNDGLDERPQESAKDLFQEMVSLTKAIEIAGTLLTHQFANYDRVSKEVAVKAIVEGPLRLVRRVYSYLGDPDELIKAVSTRVLSRRADLNAEQVEATLRRAIAHVLRLFTTAFIAKTATYLKTSDLNDNVDAVVEANPTCAFRLVRVARDLQRPVKLPRLTIERMVKEQGDNPAVMGVLQVLVLQRLYMFETEFQDKDWAMSTFELGAFRSHVGARNFPKPPPRLEK